MGSKPLQGRTTAAHDGEVTVFLVGMRINRFRAVGSWWPVCSAMPRMLKELSGQKGSGLLGFRFLLGGPRLFCVVQYWDSPHKLLAYASDEGQEHRPAWGAFNRRLRQSKGHVGIWHETYAVPAGRYESIYVDMPPFGLAASTGVQPIGGRGDRAADRMAL